MTAAGETPISFPHAGGPAPDPARGVLETLLVADGEPLELAPHLARLDASARSLFGGPAPPEVEEHVRHAAAGSALGRLRVTVAPDASGGMTTDVRLAEVDAGIVFPSWQRALVLAPITVASGWGGHKWADRRLLDRAEQGLSGCVAVVADADGSLLETSRGNLFVVEHGALATPPADGRLLPGVTRARVIELAGTLGVAVREEEVRPARLRDADEVFTTGAVRGVEPVRECRSVGTWQEGAITPRISSELKQAWLGPLPSGR